MQEYITTHRQARFWHPFSSKKSQFMGMGRSRTATAGGLSGKQQEVGVEAEQKCLHPRINQVLLDTFCC